jgi:acyl dehydratase
LEAKATTYKFEEIEIGKVTCFNRTITPEDVEVFTLLVGDRNPLHIDENFGRNSKFKRNIVHGMLCASLFSTLVGMHCPGEKCLYLGQTLQFRMPLFYGETVEVRGTVLEKFDAIRIIKMKMEILRGKDLIVFGEARVQVTD